MGAAEEHCLRSIPERPKDESRGEKREPHPPGKLSPRLDNEREHTEVERSGERKGGQTSREVRMKDDSPSTCQR